MNKENKEATAQNSRNSMSLEGRRLAKLEAINAELLAALEATEAKLTQAARAFYGAGNAKALREAFEGWRTTAEAARAAIAKATATK